VTLRHPEKHSSSPINPCESVFIRGFKRIVMAWPDSPANNLRAGRLWLDSEPSCFWVVKRTLRTLAALLILAAAGFWLAAGANCGWTKTSVPKRTLDEITGIEGISYERVLVPGLDFLAVAIVGAGILAGASLLFRAKPLESSQPVQPVIH
jgi:hypothetical protein